MAGRTSVLFIADDPGTVQTVSTLPDSDDDVEVLTEQTAAAALDRVHADGVDCVVTAYDLPDATGIDLLDSIRKRRPTLPVILYTTVPVEEIAEAAIDAGVTDYLRRDPDRNQREELGATIREALAQYNGPASVEATQDRFRTIIEQSSDIVSILNRDGTYRYQSPSVEQILGYAPEEFVGKSAFEFVHPEDRDRVVEAFSAGVDGDVDRTNLEYRFKHSDGSWRVLESRGTVMFDDPVVDGFVVNSWDVTERRRREQRMNVLNRTLRHDLRNNMNVILGNAELLMREYGSDERTETIRRTAADMLDLAGKVRDVERALDTSEAPRELVDVVSVLEQRLSALERSRPDVTIHADLPDSEWVLANRHLGSAIDDVIENAIEHNDADDPQVRVSVESSERNDHAVTITIADNGPGIPEEELAVLTEGGETPLKHTSGLGLWLVKWIVNESAGELDFGESAAGGTVVSITLHRARTRQQIEMD